MNWVGIGLISGAGRPMPEMNTLLPAIRTIVPGANWDGTAASGFSVTPSDPTRTTAKPALRLITPPNQHFTDTLDVGVIAMANDGGDLLDNFGIKRVTFHYEGSTLVVAAPRWFTMNTVRGPRTYFGWWARLKKPASQSGKARLYIEAEANDATMQKRVIGPFNFSPVDTEYDLELEINPDLPEITGQRYQSFWPAISYARTQLPHNPRFLITKSGKYEIERGPNGETAPTDQYNITGRYTIEATAPNVSIGRFAYEGDALAVLPSHRAYWRVKGTNITFDTRFVRFWGGRDFNAFPNDVGHWFDGITVTTTSPAGKNEMFRGGLPGRSATIIGGPGHLTEVNFANQNTPACQCALVRGCYFLNSAQDLISDSRCVIQNTFEQSDQSFWNSDALAFTVTVPTGDTLQRSGGNSGSGAGGGLWTATVDGDVFTFDVGNGAEAYFLGTANYNGASGIGGYWCADVVAWLNTLPGWSAALSPEFALEDRRAAVLSLPGRKGQGFTLANGRAIIGDGTPQDIVWCCDTHGDWHQHTSGILENAVIAFNRLWDCEVQLIFMAPIKRNGVAATRDVFFVANQLAADAETRLYYNPNAIASQISRPQDVSHLVIAHNTIANQRMLANFNLTGAQDVGYNLIKNNTMRAFQWNAGFVPSNIVVDGLVIHGNQTIPVNVTNYLAVGDAQSLYTDAFNGDFTPTALLREKGFVPAIPFDAARQAFPNPSIPGGVAGLADELRVIPPDPVPNDVLGTAGNALAQALAERTHGGMWLFTTAINPGLWTAANLSGSADSFVQGNADRQPQIDPALGAVFDNNDEISTSFFAGSYTVYFLFRKDAAAGNGHLLTNNLIYAEGATARAIAQAGARAFVDGLEMTSRGDTFAALDAEVAGETFWREVRCTQLNVSSLSVGRASGNSCIGSLLAAVAIPEFGYDDPEIEGPPLTAMCELARDWLLELQPGLAGYPD